jgi:uncharacterized protein
MSFDIEKFVIIDHHAHSLLKNFRELDEIGFRQCFSESRSITMLQDHMPRAVHYIDMLDHLEKVFNIKSEQEFLTFRSQQSASHFVQMLWDDVSIGALIVDDGLNSGDLMSLDEIAHVSGRPVFLCRRIEPLLEACVVEAESFSDLCASYSKRLLVSGKRRTAGLKTICGYRGGLELMHPSKAEARSDFDRLKKEIGTASTFRIGKRPLYHYLLLQSFEMAAENGVAVQIHTGIGDDDANLADCNPTIMQPLFRSRTFAKTPFVLLHCFPYVHEAAFFASLYSNVYMDLSLSVTLAAPRAAHMMAEALSVAPASKILAGSDGHCCPESHWYGALCWKRGLTVSLYDMIGAKLLTQREAEDLCALILHDNAIRLYKLEGLS